MKRKLKALGPALFAVLAMGALSASAASAGEFHSETSHTALSGSQIGEDKFVINAGTVTCQEATYSGTQSTTTATAVRLTPTYTECSAFGFVNTTVDTNGCEYELSGDNGNLTIACPAGKAITVTAFNCEVTIPAQTTSGGLTFHTEGAGSTHDVVVTGNITGITYIQHSKSFPGCSANETKLRHDGKLTCAYTIRAFRLPDFTQVGLTRF